jgi:hypothetical protein
LAASGARTVSESDGFARYAEAIAARLLFVALVRRCNTNCEFIESTNNEGTRCAFGYGTIALSQWCRYRAMVAAAPRSDAVSADDTPR